MYGSLSRRNVLTMILAGGMGERLYPLTRDRAKPAVPFAGRYRIVDFVINNFLNSGFFKIKVLTQFKSNSLIEHITRTWRLVPEIGQYVDVVPAQMRKGPFWFRGTADAVFQNLELIFDEQPDTVCVFGGDHIYKMDVGQMLQEHLANDADLTIATIPVPATESRHFGVVEIDPDYRVTGFVEKPKQGDAKTIPDRPDMILASMGNYIFKASVMIDVGQMLQEHLANDADLTIATIPVPATESRHFGVVEIDPDYRVTGFVEKPKQGDAKTIPDRPDMILASMGNYIFKASVMIDV